MADKKDGKKEVKKEEINKVAPPAAKQPTIADVIKQIRGDMVSRVNREIAIGINAIINTIVSNVKK